MTTAELLKQAETDLAFALAQGDGYAEDEASERVERLRQQMAERIRQQMADES